MNDLFKNKTPLFPTTYNEIEQRVRGINPLKYGKTRNFIDGAVTHLSPYISRGVIDTRTVFDHLVKRGFSYYQVEKFVQQLCWREQISLATHF